MPPLEVILGTVIGTVLGYTTAGYLCVEGFDNGWPSVFYIHGALSVLFTVFWYLLVFDSPDSHPRIKESEKRLIQKHLQHRDTITKASVPWRPIFTSVPVWSIFIVHSADNWLMYMLITCLPMFMDEVLQVDIQSNGIYSSLPFASMALGLLISGFMADYIRSSGWLRVTTIRKTFQISGNILASIFIVVCGYIPSGSREIVVLCICLCTFCEAIGAAAGFPCNPVDIAPRFAGVIFGISNTIASVPGLLTAIAVSEMTQNNTPEEWRHVFFLCAGLVCVASIVYGLGASSELAPWAYQEPMEIEVEPST